MRLEFGPAGVVFLCLLTLVACSSGSSQEEAIAVADKYYDAVSHQDWDRALTVLGGDDSPGVWRSRLLDTNRTLGPLQSHKLKSVEVNTVYRGRFFILEYDTTYARGKAVEMMTVAQAVNDPILRILSIKAETPAN